MTGPMAKEDNMPLVTTTEMFKKGCVGGYDIVVLKVRSLESVQGMVDAARGE